LKNKSKFTDKKNTVGFGGIFSDALKGRKGEKEMGVLNWFLGPKSRGERM